MSIFRFRRFWTDRTGVTALLFAVSLPTVMLAVALAIDFGGAINAKTKLDLAADAGAITAATTASQMFIAGGSTTEQIKAAGQTAGQNRFFAEFGSLNNVTPPSPLSVSVIVSQDPITNAFSALLTDSATYTPYFATLLGAPSVSLSASSSVSVTLTAPYLNVEILLDNSGSMEIAAMPSDIAIMQELTACARTNAYYCTATTTKNGKTSCSTWAQSGPIPGNSNPFLPSSDRYHTSTASDQSYSAYGCSGGGNSYIGSPSCPLSAATLDGVSYPALPVGSAPNCPSLLPMPAGEVVGDANWFHSGLPPRAGPPCAFACHFDTSSAAGTGNDFYALARSTIGTAYPVNLRFDLVKSAVKQVIATMQADNLPVNNLKVGIFWFADILQQVYPMDGTEAGGDWATALSDVGGPSSTANGADTGIQPYVGANGGNTDFPAIMTDLAFPSPEPLTRIPSNGLKRSGNGATSTTPRKVLFIVTDGLEDPASRAISAFNPDSCTTFKTMGYGIYVLYTPYYSLMNPYYLNNAAAIVQAAPTATHSIPYNLQQCASSPANYIEASDSASIAAALQTFLKQALASRARITQ